MEKILEFDPVHRTLRDTDGRILKKVNCPKLKSWDSLSVSSDAQTLRRHCDTCEKSVIDTALLTYEEVVDAVKQDPQVCFRIRLDQGNIEIKVRHDGQY